MTDDNIGTAHKEPRTALGMLKALQEEGAQLPPLFAQMLEPDAAIVPIAIGTREALEAWCDDKGYTQGQKRRVQRMMQKLVHWPAYLMAMSGDEARRFNIDGSVAGPVDDIHRLAAALELIVRTPQGAKPQAPAPAPTPNERSTVSTQKDVPSQPARPASLPRATQAREVIVTTMKRRLTADELSRRAHEVKAKTG